MQFRSQTISYSGKWKIYVGKLPQYLLYSLRYKEYNCLLITQTNKDKQIMCNVNLQTIQKSF